MISKLESQTIAFTQNENTHFIHFIPFKNTDTITVSIHHILT